MENELYICSLSYNVSQTRKYKMSSGPDSTTPFKGLIQNFVYD